MCIRDSAGGRLRHPGPVAVRAGRQGAPAGTRAGGAGGLRRRYRAVLRAGTGVAWVLEQDGKRLGKILRPLIDSLMSVLDGPNHCQRAQATYLQITGALRP